MKRKLFLLLFCFLLAVPFYTQPTVQAADTKSATISIPVSTGLTGSANSAKVFNLELPSGVSSSAIKSDSFKYNGTNSVIGSIGIENGKIKLTLKGRETTETISNVQGFSEDFGKPFTTTPGNSIWLYSDGRRWQINDYKASTNSMDSYDVNANDGKVPSEDPPLRAITTQSIIGTNGLSWYNNSADIKISADSIIQSSVKALEFSNKDFRRTPNINGVSFKNGRIIIDYMIPKASNDKESFKTKWTEEPDDGKHDLSGHAEGRRYQVTGYYYYLADAKVTSFSYSGTLSFDYNLPTEPTLTGEAQLLKPNPNPTQATGSDIPVTLSLKGLLSAYTDTSNIQEWVFYAKETGNDSTLQTKKDYSKVLTSTQTFDFKIPKSKTTPTSFNQEYTLSVVVRFTKPIITADGTISSLSATFTSKAGTYNGTPPPNIPEPITPPSSGKPPEARITMPDQVVAGEKFIVSGADSFDPDGTIVKYTWQHPNVEDALYGKSSDTGYGLDSIDTTQTITLTVVDNDGLTATTSRDIKVVAPAPAAKLQVLGTLKENRKITLHNASKNVADDFPMIPSKTKFTVSAVSGGTNADIKYSGSLTGTDDADILIKVAGQYKATLYVENTAGYSATKSITFTIVPDQAPVPYISMPNTVYRDPSNGNKASVTLDDLSISPDYDYLAKRVWEYRYDSDNDGNYAEEAWVLMNNGNLDRINFYPTEVGRYEIRITTKEEFGQPTIDEFVTVNDRKSADTANQNVAERIVTVLNRPPLSDWSW